MKKALSAVTSPKIKAWPLLFLLLGCSSIPVVIIREHKLVGHWKTDSGHLVITCNGAFDIDLVDKRTLPESKQHEQGSYIADIRGDEIVIGPFSMWRKPYHVDQWPHSKGEDTVMTIDGIDWKLEKTSLCPKLRSE